MAMANSRIPGCRAVNLNLPRSLLAALKARAASTGESTDHIVQEALARRLDVPQHTMFQVSTSTALVQGVYQGCVTVGTVKQRGDFGLGTCDASTVKG